MIMSASDERNVNTAASTQLPVVLLTEALKASPVLFGRSTVKPLDKTTKALRRNQKKLATVFGNLPEAAVKDRGILHEKSGVVFVEARIASSTFLLGCLTPKPEPLQSGRPLELVSGICMFGAGALMGQADGTMYDLTYPDDMRRIQGVIEHITVDERSHLYEVEAIARLGAFIQSMCRQLPSTHIKLTLHLPVPEYFMYGLDLYTRGHMSAVALRTYMAAVSRRGKKLESMLKECFKTGVAELTVGSPLSWLRDSDFLTLSPAEIPRILYDRAAQQNSLWRHLVGKLADRQPLQLNYLSYAYQYLEAAGRMQDNDSQLVFVENPEELPIYLNAVKWQQDIGVAVDKATMLYVHPRLMVVRKAYADHGNFLYYCADGFNQRAVDLAAHAYESNTPPLG